MMKITLKDIAKDTGFSVSTISRAIRGEGRISDDNRRAILASAHKLGYPLPTNGRAIPDNFPEYIALITKFQTGEFYSSYYYGFLEAAIKKGVQIGVFSIPQNSNNPDELIEQLRTLGFTAAVLFIPDLSESDYQHILHSTPTDFPIISNSNIDNSVLDTVTFDAYQGATLVAKHFHEMGFRKLGIIEGPARMPESRFRTNGFRDFITHVAEEEVIWSYRGDYTLEAGVKAFKDFYTLPEKPEAVFAANDAMAVGFLESARKNGISIPEDIAVVGYDNLPICETHYPTITSVNTNYTLLAENTIDILLARKKGPNQHQGIVSLVPVTLSVRDSSRRN